MISSQDSVFQLKPQNVTIAPGATLAVYYPQQMANVNTLVKYISGGTLLVVGATPGITLAAASLVQAFASAAFYILGTAEVLSLGGPTSFYLMASGSTAVGSVLQGLSQDNA